MLIVASDITCIVQVVELTDAHTARGLTLMMIYFYHLPRNLKKNCVFRPSFTCHRILVAIPPTIFVKVVSHAVLGTHRSVNCVSEHFCHQEETSTHLWNFLK